MKNFPTLFLCTLLFVLATISLASPVDNGIALNNSCKKNTALPKYLSANIYALNTDGTTSLEDGNMTMYDSTYSNSIDLNDFRKVTNIAENFGILRDGVVLAIEKRQPIKLADTVFFKMWNMRQITYQLVLTASGLTQPGLTGYLEDSYLHTTTTIGLDTVTTINFTITSDSASANPYRFRVIYKTISAVNTPAVTNINCVEKDKDLVIGWETNCENNVKEYELEKSVNHGAFVHLTTVTEVRNEKDRSSYSYTDHDAALPGNNAYRLKTYFTNGNIDSSSIAKISITNTEYDFAVFPNPIVGSTVSFQLNNLPAGLYSARLLNNFGRLIKTQLINYTGGVQLIKIEPGKAISSGTYHLELSNSKGWSKVTRLLILN